VLYTCIFLILKILTFVTCSSIEKIQVFKFKYESTREREREREQEGKREREMKKGKGKKYANATRCHLPPTHQSKFSPTFNLRFCLL